MFSISYADLKAGLGRLFRLCLPLAAGLLSLHAHAVPSFARQTGQNCVACHAGGQFPELTPYGRMFKLTGYTLGTRGLPLAVMAVVGGTKTNNPQTVQNVRDGSLVFATGSVFVAGKVTDNIGGFAQFTYDNYGGDNGNGTGEYGKGRYIGHFHSDNLDVRYADRNVAPERDLVWGVAVNNNPSAQDVWNSAPAWGWGVVPGSIGPAGSKPVLFGLGPSVAGAGAYVYWNRTVYAELSAYRSADGIFSFMSQGFGPRYTSNYQQTYVKGLNPYWRLALTHDWGAHSIMVGAMGLTVDKYNGFAGFDGAGNPVGVNGPQGDTDRMKDWGLDAQYQYILDPVTVTALASYVREDQHFSATSLANGSSDGKLNQLQLKTSVVYRAKYGTTLALARGTGSNQAGSSTRSVTGELFWIPVQNVRLGVQRTNFWDNGSAVSGGKPVTDYNQTMFYVWGAF